MEFIIIKKPKFLFRLTLITKFLVNFFLPQKFSKFIRLRSGKLNQPPKRQFISPYQIFYKEQLQILLSQGVGINMVGNQIQKAWQDMTNEMHQYYEDQFEQCEEKFQEQLIYFYGGNQKHINQWKEFKNIPSKPKRPLSPQFEYIIKNRHKFSFKNFNWKQSYQILIDEYCQQSHRVLEQLEVDYERKMKEYKDAIDKWNEKYAEKYKTLKKNTLEIYKKQKTENQFEYQELQFVRSIKKMSSNKKEEQTQNNADCNDVKSNNLKDLDFGLREVDTNLEQFVEESQQLEQKKSKKGRRF
ncbi:unnamed protein product [Paramecium sonneborni]|uniref:HMG box domain-containing protein n=1 Tax=Paramecium sonneborni TaxID=65129 RepID=A0A8S1R7T3_9CILI|nr:unnamed protein product [Paramecium sonneborni]